MVKLRAIESRLNAPKSRFDTMKKATGSWRSDLSAAKRGYDRHWRRYREQYLSEHRYCCYCLRERGLLGTESNEVVEARFDAVALVRMRASVVDHIKPHRGDIKGPDSLFWRASNHQALCKHCHDSVKQKEEAKMK